MDMLCSDKTGTLTRNELTVGEPFAVQGSSRQAILQAAGWASRADDQDAIDSAVLSAARQTEVQGAQAQVVRFVRFDPVHKRTEATVQPADGPQFKVAKGAAQSILALARAPETVSKLVLEAVDGFAKRGFRSLAVARGALDDTWQVLGVLPLFDPPRADSAETLKRAAQMGIEVQAEANAWLRSIPAPSYAGADDLSRILLEPAIHDARATPERQSALNHIHTS